MRELAERASFQLCLALGRLLRAGRYSRTRLVRRDGAIEVRKHRLPYAPLLVRLGGPLVAALDTGVRVLPQRAWEERERRLYRCLRGAEVRVEGDGTLVLPWLPGATLATLLEDPWLDEPARRRAIELAAVALAEFHRLGHTHGDAMAENVMVDLEGGVAHWFDFETVHDARRPILWRRADDVRALLATTLLRTAPERLPATLRLVLDAYANAELERLVAASFTPAVRRPLTFHLGQAALSHRAYTVIARTLQARIGR